MRWKPSRRRYWDLMIYLDRRRKRRRERLESEQPELLQVLSTDDGSPLSDDDNQLMETY